jgi:Nucleoside-diphosphate-sugar epimerases
MKTALVTGAAGFIGRSLVKELVNQGVYVYAVLRPNSKNTYKNFNQNLVSVIECDIAHLSDLPNKINQKIDVFYHLAWEGSAGSKRSDVLLQLNNIEYTINAVEIAKTLGCIKFVGAGSIMEKETIIATETQTCKLGTGYIYGAAKFTAHSMSKAIAAKIGIDHLWPMITNAYGEGEVSPRFINTTIKKMINHEPLEFTSATQNYDFVYISDVSRAFYLIGEKGKPFCEYLIGSSNAQPLKEFILSMQKQLAPNQKLLFGDIPFTGINLPLETFSCLEIEKDVGFKPLVSFVEGIELTHNWLLR